MRKCKWEKKNILKVILIIVLVIAAGLGGYCVCGENGIILPQEEHIYEIGSITKTFTTSLLCKAISEGRINLYNSIDKYLSLRKKDYYPTIRRLVTHTSGYKGYYFKKPMNNYILEDLGLTNTKISDYSGDLNNYWKWSESDAYLPADAILSNITDMMQYAQVQMREIPEIIRR